jgi:Chitobiase/beta-hexosaminidase C-terminal domain
MKRLLTSCLAFGLFATIAQGQTVSTVVSGQGEPYGVAVEPSDNAYYFTDSMNNRVLKYDPASASLSVIVEGASGFSPLLSPSGLAWGKSGGASGLAVADTGYHLLQFIDLRGGDMTRLAGSTPGFADGAALNAQFDFPAGLAIDPASGTIYIADAFNNAVRSLDTSGQVETLATGFYKPAAVAVGDTATSAVQGGTQTTQQIWVADTLDDVIQLVTITRTTGSATVLYTTNVVAGQFRVAGSTDSRDGLSATFNGPRGLLWLGGQTGLLIADSGNNTIRQLQANVIGGSYSVSTFAGAPPPAVPGLVDGTLTAARFDSPVGLAVDAEGAILVADLKNQALRKISRVQLPAPTILANGLATTGGAFSNAVDLAFADSVSGATIYRYTLDGTAPTPLIPAATSLTLAGGSGDAVTLLYKAYSPDYEASQIVSNSFTFFVADPASTPASASDVNPVTITVAEATDNARVYWTTDGSEPTPASAELNLNNGIGTILVAQSGTLNLKSFRAGFADSKTVSVPVNLVCATPVISPSGASNNSPVTVSITCSTANAAIYWTTDGTDPTPSSTLYTGPFVLAANGTLKVKAFKAGFTDSPTASADFNLVVATPVVTPLSSTNIDSVTVTVNSATANAGLHYTTDGSAPTTSSPLYTGPLTLTTNTLLTVVGFLQEMTPSATISNSYAVQVDTPSMSPASGYFPNGSTVTFSVNNPKATIYYTTDGSEPTVTSAAYTAPIEVDQISYPSSDMRLIRARAFAPNALPSAIVSGQSFATNTVGVPTDMAGGIGSRVIVPVVADLAPNQPLKTLQFRLEIVPASPNAPPLTDDISAIDITPNDFVPVVVNADGSETHFTYNSYRSGATNGTAFASTAPTNGLDLQDFGVLMNAVVPIPNSAHQGDTYKISILQVSGTRDDWQGSIPLSPLPSRTLTVTNIPYLAGDSSLGRWYNAGDFGNGNLDNADVNNARLASFGIHVPPAFSDAFNAMDTYPPDAPGIVGGDGQIRYLDWITILNRSLRLDNQNWVRAHAAGGVLTNWSMSLPNNRIKPKAANPVPPGQVWLCQARLLGGAITNVLPGHTYSVPVTLQVLPGYAVAGLQFRVTLEPANGAPAATQPVVFTPVVGVPPTLQTYGNDVLCSWAPTGSFTPSLEGSNLLGYVQCVVPAGSQPGQSYALRFSYCDGAPGLQTQYNFESFPASLWVASPAQQAPSITSDEWKTKFFGGVTSPQAADNADPDGDGVPNWQEYLAGTDPSDPLSHLALSTSIVASKTGAPAIALSWLTAPGKNYELQTAPDIRGPWAPLGEVSGDGYSHQTLISTPPAQGQFYRLRLAQ